MRDTKNLKPTAFVCPWKWALNAPKREGSSEPTHQFINFQVRSCCYFQGGFLAQLPCQITRVWLYISSSRHPCSHWQSFTSGELLYCTILQPTMEKERKLKNQYSPKGCNIFTCSLFLQVLLRSSVPLPASAKKHSSIAIYPSWPRSQRLSWLSQLAGLPLMWSSQFLFLRPFEWTRSINSNKKPWKILPSPKKGNPYFMGKKAYRNWKLMQKKPENSVSIHNSIRFFQVFFTTLRCLEKILRKNSQSISLRVR